MNGGIFVQTVKPRKIPERRCIGCNEHFPKKELIRIVRLPDGNIALDTTGKMSGRGAYLCHKVECFRRARKAKRAEAALSCPIPESVYDAMEAQFDAK